MKKKRVKAKVDVDYLAQLSNLEIASSEKRFLGKQLEETVDYVEILGELKTAKIAPIAQVANLENVVRLDQPRRELTQKEALKNTKRKQGGFFVTKKVKWEQK